MSNLKYVGQIYRASYIYQIAQKPFLALQHNLQRRYFFTVQGRKDLHNRKLVGYSCEQMFDVVSDVQNYKHFLPFCKKSFVVKESSDFIEAALEVGFPPFLESYTSRVVLVKPHFVKATCFDGRLFDHLVTTWKFTSGLKSNPNSCIVDFAVNFQFKSLLHSGIAHMFFDKVVKQMEGAFLIEARRRYGTPTVPSHPLAVGKS